MTHQIVLTDDQPMVRHCVRQILADENDLEIIAEVEDGQALLDLLDEGAVIPDLMIADISMPKIEGIEAIRRIKLRHPGVKTLLLTMHQEQDYLVARPRCRGNRISC